MNTELVVGCPIRGRTWIIKDWLEAVKAAASPALFSHRNLHFAFACDPADPVVKLITAWCAKNRFGVSYVLIPEYGAEVTRGWNLPERLEHMVKLRNGLLREVRVLEPSYFLSLDSDILIHPEALGGMLNALYDNQDWGAVGGRCYMHPAGIDFPSWGRLLPGGGLQRVDAEGTFPADVIMAIKLMRPTAYSVDYSYDAQGEDIGWSRDCAAAGVRLGWHGAVISKHCMDEDELRRVDARVGY